MEEINTLLEKYNHFRDAQIRHIESPADRSKVIITMVVEDDESVVQDDEMKQMVLIVMKMMIEARRKTGV